MAINFMLLFSRQGKIRLQKWYTTVSQKEKKRVMREMTTLILTRRSKMCNVVEWKNYKIVYKRYASLYFVAAVEADDNELIVLEIIYRFVDILDKYFGSVCELDIIFNYEKAYYILDEIVMGGEIQESSKRCVLRSIAEQDQMQDAEEMGNPVVELMGDRGI